MNGDSGGTPKAFTINQNECSRSSRIGVHDGPESVFMMGQNMQISRAIESYITSMGAPKSLLEKIESISSEDVELLSYEFINKYLRGYSLKYQEWIIAQCGGGISELMKKADVASKTDEKKFWEITKKIADITKCEGDLIQKETEKSFYPTIKAALSNVDEDYIPRRSIMENMKDKLPFNLSHLIGKVNLEAMDLLSLIGIPSKYSKSEIKKFNNAEFFIDNKSMIIGFDTEGKVYSIRVPFYSSEYSKVFNRHFLTDLNIASGPSEFVKQYGKPSHQGCPLLDECYLLFTTLNADLQVLFNKDDRSLRAIEINKPGFWDKIYRKIESSKKIK